MSDEELGSLVRKNLHWLQEEAKEVNEKKGIFILNALSMIGFCLDQNGTDFSISVEGFSSDKHKYSIPSNWIVSVKAV